MSNNSTFLLLDLNTLSAISLHKLVLVKLVLVKTGNGDESSFRCWMVKWLDGWVVINHVAM